MALNDVKELTVPVNGVDKAVKKIEDANGNIIWGSQTEYPYRRLEYIDMYGRYASTSARYTNNYYFLDMKINTSEPINSDDGYGVYLGSAGSNSRRLFIQGTGSTSQKVQYRLKDAATADMVSWSSLSSDTMYQLRLRNYYANNTNGQYYFAFAETGGSALYTKSYNSTTYSMNTTEIPNIYINAHAYNSSGTTAVPTNIIHKGALNFKLYRYFTRVGDGGSTINRDFYPVQRKSDGVVGMYDCLNSTFFPILDASTDANITTRTEPIVDEYWDLTAPA